MNNSASSGVPAKVLEAFEDLCSKSSERALLLQDVVSSTTQSPRPQLPLRPGNNQAILFDALKNSTTEGSGQDETLELSSLSVNGMEEHAAPESGPQNMAPADDNIASFLLSQPGNGVLSAADQGERDWHWPTVGSSPGRLLQQEQLLTVSQTYQELGNLSQVDSEREFAMIQQHLGNQLPMGEREGLSDDLNLFVDADSQVISLQDSSSDLVHFESGGESSAADVMENGEGQGVTHSTPAKHPSHQDTAEEDSFETSATAKILTPLGEENLEADATPPPLLDSQGSALDDVNRDSYAEGESSQEALETSDDYDQFNSNPPELFPLTQQEQLQDDVCLDQVQENGEERERSVERSSQGLARPMSPSVTASVDKNLELQQTAEASVPESSPEVLEGRQLRPKTQDQLETKVSVQMPQLTEEDSNRFNGADRTLAEHTETKHAKNDVICSSDDQRASNQSVQPMEIVPVSDDEHSVSSKGSKRGERSKRQHGSEKVTDKNSRKQHNGFRKKMKSRMPTELVSSDEDDKKGKCDSKEQFMEKSRLAPSRSSASDSDTAAEAQVSPVSSSTALEKPCVGRSSRVRSAGSLQTRAQGRGGKVSQTQSQTDVSAAEKIQPFRTTRNRDAPPKRARKRKEGMPRSRSSSEEKTKSSEQHPSCPQCLHEWIVIPCPPKQGVYLEGRKSLLEDTFWQTGLVVKRVAQDVVETLTGSCYRLMGPLCVEEALSAGCPQKLVDALKHGFPLQWQKTIQDCLKDLESSSDPAMITDVPQTEWPNSHVSEPSKGAGSSLDPVGGTNSASDLSESFPSLDNGVSDLSSGHSAPGEVDTDVQRKDSEVTVNAGTSHQNHSATSSDDESRTRQYMSHAPRNLFEDLHLINLLPNKIAPKCCSLVHPPNSYPSAAGQRQESLPPCRKRRPYALRSKAPSKLFGRLKGEVDFTSTASSKKNVNNVRKKVKPTGAAGPNTMIVTAEIHPVPPSLRDNPVALNDTDGENSLFSSSPSCNEELSFERSKPEEENENNDDSPPLRQGGTQALTNGPGQPQGGKATRTPTEESDLSPSQEDAGTVPVGSTPSLDQERAGTEPLGSTPSVDQERAETEPLGSTPSLDQERAETEPLGSTPSLDQERAETEPLGSTPSLDQERAGTEPLGSTPSLDQERAETEPLGSTPSLDQERAETEPVGSTPSLDQERAETEPVGAKEAAKLKSAVPDTAEQDEAGSDAVNCKDVETDAAVQKDTMDDAAKREDVRTNAAKQKDTVADTVKRKSARANAGKKKETASDAAMQKDAERNASKWKNRSTSAVHPLPRLRNLNSDSSKAIQQPRQVDGKTIEENAQEKEERIERPETRHEGKSTRTETKQDATKTERPRTRQREENRGGTDTRQREENREAEIKQDETRMERLRTRQREEKRGETETDQNKARSKRLRIRQREENRGETEMKQDEARTQKLKIGQRGENGGETEMKQDEARTKKLRTEQREENGGETEMKQDDARTGKLKIGQRGENGGETEMKKDEARTEKLRTRQREENGETETKQDDARTGKLRAEQREENGGETETKQDEARAEKLTTSRREENGGETETKQDEARTKRPRTRKRDSKQEKRGVERTETKQEGKRVEGVDSRQGRKFLSEWIIRPMPQQQGVCVEGKLRGCTEFWHSSAIVERVSAKTVLTSSGSCYCLRGCMDSQEALLTGFTREVITAFRNGFPARWKDIIQMYYSGSPIQKKIPKPASPHTPLNQKIPDFKQEVLQTPLGQSLDLQNIPQTRSGRHVRPRLAWYAGQHFVVNPETNSLEVQYDSAEAKKFLQGRCRRGNWIQGTPVRTFSSAKSPQRRPAVVDKTIDLEAEVMEVINRSKEQRSKAKERRVTCYSLGASDLPGPGQSRHVQEPAAARNRHASAASGDVPTESRGERNHQDGPNCCRALMDVTKDTSVSSSNLSCSPLPKDDDLPGAAVKDDQLPQATQSAASSSQDSGKNSGDATPTGKPSSPVSKGGRRQGAKAQGRKSHKSRQSAASASQSSSKSSENSTLVSNSDSAVPPKVTVPKKHRWNHSKSKQDSEDSDFEQDPAPVEERGRNLFSPLRSDVYELSSSEDDDDVLDPDYYSRSKKVRNYSSKLPGREVKVRRRKKIRNSKLPANSSNSIGSRAARKRKKIEIISEDSDMSEDSYHSPECQDKVLQASAPVQSKVSCSTDSDPNSQARKGRALQSKQQEKVKDVDVEEADAISMPKKMKASSQGRQRAKPKQRASRSRRGQRTAPKPVADSVDSDSEQQEDTQHDSRTSAQSRSKTLSPLHDEEEGDAAWTKEEAGKLHLALQRYTPDDKLYWQKVAAMVGSRSQDECQTFYFKDFTRLKDPKKRKKKEPAKKPGRDASHGSSAFEGRAAGLQSRGDRLGGVGTLKRKQQLRDYVEHCNKDYEDDLFDSTPFRAAKKKVSRLDIGMTNEELFGPNCDAFTPGNEKFRTPSIGVLLSPRSERKTPAAWATPVSAELNKRNVDLYVRNINRRKLVKDYRNPKSKIASTPARPKPTTLPDVTDLFSSATVTTVEKDEEEEDFYYWSDELDE